jgi:hypothetical protein
VDTVPELCGKAQGSSQQTTALSSHPCPATAVRVHAGLQQLFRSIDADGSGTITVDELRTALGQVNGGRLTVRALRFPLLYHHFWGFAGFPGLSGEYCSRGREGC